MTHEIGDFFDDTEGDTIPAPMPPPMEWDPGPDERTFYRSSSDGQRGYMVRRGGKDVIRLDRPMEEILRPFNESQWTPDEERRPMSIAQVAQVAWAADRKVCLYTGKPELARTDWLDMREAQRIAWIKEGPPGDIRQLLFKTIMATLQPFTR